MSRTVNPWIIAVPVTLATLMEALDSSIAGAQHDYEGDVADLRQADANNVRAQADLRRYKQLLDKNEIAESEYDQYDTTAKAQAVARSQPFFPAPPASAGVAPGADLPSAKRNSPWLAWRPRHTAAQVSQQQMNLTYCRILAPVSGLVSQRTAEVGARVSIGQQLMLLVQTKGLWVTGKFKETQLRRVRLGQRVTVNVDGLDKKFDGYVESLPASTGDRTSAVPPENATGNFVKIVQRMPLRIRFRETRKDSINSGPGCQWCRKSTSTRYELRP